jgi:glycosyltransferase involved in cell wall biosynthesis
MENMKKKKILYVITKSNWGGAQRSVFDLASNLPKEYESIVALGGDGSLKTRLEEAGIRTISLPFLTRDVRLFFDFLVLKKLISLFRDERPDIIHLNSSKIGGLGALAGRIAKVPNIIFTAHGWAFREERSEIQKAAIKFLSWLTMLWSHSVITVSERDQREAAAFPFVKKKIILIHNGISEPEFLPKDTARKMMYEKNTAEALWIGAIGELHKNKGHKYAIEALAAIQSKHNAMFFIIGEGEERRALEKTITDLGLRSKVILLGNKDDAVKLLPAFDIFLFPSVKEGLPYTILEAGLAGLPAIASAVGGIPEVITDMESGILVRPKSPEEIARAFDFLLSHKKEMANLGKKLHANVKKNFSFKKMLRETVALYDAQSKEQYCPKPANEKDGPSR